MTEWLPPNSIWLALLCVPLFQCVLVALLVPSHGVQSPAVVLLGFFGLTSLVGHLLMPFSLLGVDLSSVALSTVWEAVARAELLNGGCFLLAYFMLVLLPLPSAEAPAPGGTHMRLLNISARRALLVASLAAGVGVACLLVTFYTTSVVPAFTSDPDMKHFIGVSGYTRVRPFYAGGQHWLTFSATVGLAVLAGFFTRPRKHLLWALGVAAASLLFLVLTMKRGPILLPILLVCGALFYDGRLSLRCFLSVIALIFAFAVAKWLLQRSGSSQSVLRAVTMNVAVEPREFSRLLMAKMSYRHFPMGYGRTYLASLLSFVPTALFPFKAAFHLGRFQNPVLGIPSNVPASPRTMLTGEALLNFGYFGPFLVGIVFGGLLHALQSYYRKVKKTITDGDVRMLWAFFLTFLMASFLTSGSIALQRLLLLIPLLMLMVWKTPAGNRPNGEKLAA